MSVRRTKMEVSSKEFVSWQAFDRLEPPEPERSDARTALICYTIASTVVGLFDSEKAKKLSPNDFMPQWSGGTKRVETKISVKKRRKLTANKVTAVMNAMMEKQNRRRSDV